MKRYVGLRARSGCVVLVFDDERIEEAPLNPRLDLARYSPSGFEWGYSGAGPAQLALALLADALGCDARAIALHQDFKQARIAAFERDISWALSEAEVRAWADDFAKQFKHGEADRAMIERADA